MIVTGAKIKNFKCFAALEMSEMKRVTVIGGKNNVGKTAFLEALFMFFGKRDLATPMSLLLLRGMQGKAQRIEDLFGSLFYNHATNKRVELALSYKGNGEDELWLTLDKKPKEKTVKVNPKQGFSKTANPLSDEHSFREYPYGTLTPPVGLQFNCLEFGKKPRKKWETVFDGEQLKFQKGAEPKPDAKKRIAHFLSSKTSPDDKYEISLYGDLIVSNREKEVLSVVSLVDDEIQSLTLAGPEGGSVFGDVGLDRKIPISQMGDGVIRMFRIAVRALTARNGYLLIDEGDAGLHQTVQLKFWEALLKIAKENNIQIFVTTHSHEFIEAVHEAASGGNEDEFSYVRLERNEGNHSAVTINHQKLKSIIEQGWEYR
jgi:hypothetical protein